MTADRPEFQEIKGAERSENLVKEANDASMKDILSDRQTGAAGNALVEKGVLPSVTDKDEIPASRETSDAINQYSDAIKANDTKAIDSARTNINDLIARNDREITTLQNQMTSISNRMSETQVAMTQADQNTRQEQLGKANQIV